MIGDICESIRVVVTDDQPVARRGLAAFVLAFDDLILAGQAASGEEAISLCACLQPDVVLMDLKMPGMGGVAATHTIRTRWPAIQVIVLSAFPEPALYRAALEAGAARCLAKGVAAHELVEAIRAAHRAGYMEGTRPSPSPPPPSPSQGEGRGEGLSPSPSQGEGRGEGLPPSPSQGEGRGEGLPPSPSQGEGRG